MNFDGDATREARLTAALSDPNSGYYKNLCRALEEAEAMSRAARASARHVTIPFFVEDGDITGLEEQFGVAIKINGATSRDRCTPRVAAMIQLLDAALSEHAGSGGRSMLLIDGDVVSLLATTMEGRIVERTHCSARVAYGYFVQDEVLKLRKTSNSPGIRTNAESIALQVAAGSGEHFSSKLRMDGPKVESIIVNHFRTPMGLSQAAWLSFCREGVVYGAIPFQLEMLTMDEGELACFPGRFYIDRECDVITLVPAADASMSISHPYRMLMEFVQHNHVVVAGQEFVCEKYMSVRGILYYTVVHIDKNYEAPETLRAHYYDADAARYSVVSYPKAKLSEEGVPVGFERKSVRVLTSRLERVLARVGVTRNVIAQPAEVYSAFMDYNNMIVNTLDTAVQSERMDEMVQADLSVAVALLVNWRRHQAHGTLNTLLNAIKTRHAVADMFLPKFAWLALSAWWSSPTVGKEVVDELPWPKVADWCGYDFSVVIEEVNPWIEIADSQPQELTPVHGCFWLPVPRSIKPKRDSGVGGGASAEPVSVASSVKSSAGPDPVSKWLGRPSTQEGTTAVAMVTSEQWKPSMERGELTQLKMSLREKMLADQGAYDEVVPKARVEIVEGYVPRTVPMVPVPDVEPVSCLRSDMDIILGGLPEMDSTKIGYRLAETEIDKVTSGSMQINDAKRTIPKARFVRKPRVDLGVEGNRVQSAAALMGAVFKRNVGIPNNRGFVDLDVTPRKVAERLINVCFVSDWQSIVSKHINAGMWEPNAEDIDSFLTGADEHKVKKMLKEFFSEGLIELDRWKLMAKGKIKPKREEDADAKITHSQTILFLEQSSTNAMYSAITRRVNACIAECMRPNIKLNPAWSDAESEEWYNSCEPFRRAAGQTYSYSADSADYDRSQEHPCLRLETELYKMLGLDGERLAKWETVYGKKKAMSMMYGIVLYMVLGGLSGYWKTLLRNGIINLAAVVVAADLRREDIVTLEIKGDDMDGEFSRPIKVENAVARMSLTFNLASKFHTNDVRYFCKKMRIKLGGRWIEMADPWARAQSLCTPIWIESGDVNLVERWESLRAELRHYDNELAISVLAEATQKYYGLKIAPYGICRALSYFARNKAAYMGFFLPPERVD